ncbi:MAG: multifunctional CCA addition/repair protein [Gammaproteobacteria bacterium]|nr:multifunctional CCA addition/repair protein [Gammaproteobacteria bacterium]
MKIYLVGGAVRDKLMGFTPTERDWVVVGARSQDLESLGYKQVGKDFPVYLHPKTHEEYALARTERKTKPGYKGFTVHASPEVTLHEDLERRDLTINAIAEDEHGELIDPFGGIKDIDNKILRHVSPAFAEDPVRILRLARFAARFSHLGFSVAPETNELMKTMVANGEVDALVPERVWKEMERALAMPTPQRFFEILRGCGALERLFPELEALYGVPQPEQHHPEVDTGVHTMLVLEQAARLSDDTQVRFAALVHDLGKGITPQDEWPKHKEHEEKGVELVENLCKRYRVPNDYRDLAVHVTRYHLHYHRAMEMKASTILKLLQNIDAFRKPQRFERFLLACEADARGRTGFENRQCPQSELLRQALKAATSENAKTLVDKGFTGKKLGDELYRLRVLAIKHVVQSFIAPI